MLASMLAPRLTLRWGNGVLSVGVAIYAAGLALLMAQALWGEALAHPLRLLPGLVVLGFGQALSMTPLLNLVLGLAQERQAGMAAGLVATVQQVGARWVSWSAASVLCRCWRAAARRNAMPRPLPVRCSVIWWRWASP